MKKILSFMLASAALLAVSCQKEVNPEDLSNADATVTVTVNLPDGINTKAIGDGTTVDKVYFEIWSQGFVKKLYKAESSISEMKASFEFQLVRGALYSFVFWACDSDAGIYTWDSLKEITINYGDGAGMGGHAAGNNESRDAFSGTYNTAQIVGDETLAVNLTRPFAQLNFGTDDMAGTSVGDITLNSSTIKVYGLAQKFDATTGLGGEETADVTFNATGVPAETLTIDKEYKYLSMNYLLPSNNSAATPKVDATFNITYQDETKDVNHSFAAVPIKANYRTNIIGSLFTASGSVTATIVDDFATPAGQVTVNKDGTNTITPIL